MKIISIHFILQKALLWTKTSILDPITNFYEFMSTQSCETVFNFLWLPLIQSFPGKPHWSFLFLSFCCIPFHILSLMVSSRPRIGIESMCNLNRNITLQIEHINVIGRSMKWISGLNDIKGQMWFSGGMVEREVTTQIENNVSHDWVLIKNLGKILTFHFED